MPLLFKSGLLLGDVIAGAEPLEAEQVSRLSSRLSSSLIEKERLTGSSEPEVTAASVTKEQISGSADTLEVTGEVEAVIATPTTVVGRGRGLPGGFEDFADFDDQSPDFAPIGETVVKDTRLPKTRIFLLLLAAGAVAAYFYSKRG